MTFPLATLGPTITSAGITAPSFADILQSLQVSFALIYGSDVYLGNDTQDGQLLAIFAQAISDSNQVAIAVYNSFRPSFAQGAGLSSLVKLNGIARLVASNSQVDLLIGGSVGTTIANGVAADSNGNLWALPASVTIPTGGSITITATCTQPGAIAANPGTITTINTPTLGWSTVTNPTAASQGAPVETDSGLRQRQVTSVALPALTVFDATIGAVEAITGVTEVKGYENDTSAPDSNGVPGHSISLVVLGGADTAVAQAIEVKKTPGCGTYGTTSVPITDAQGVVHVINFFRPINERIVMTVTIKALGGYSSTIGAAIQQTLADYINQTLNIGDEIIYLRLPLPAQLYGQVANGSNTFNLEGLQAAIFGNPLGTIDIPIAFNAKATLATSDVTLVVT